ncbi:hypothetical protein BJ322DRAFT_1112327 [Thelephora terrestris]|uniref:Uncharacterized protein n=1 Tax=Thelephora terrestris TaxID=56493 RepID=A0A9P6H7H1_9AGAM|nr:hypothetical protein BJ322DRAFT_1112303 [Thelephora terrestris]KAF9780945.1 hypothetical protein BJ322DRAFT_1112327 [Thelephora terrestris]
MSQNRTRAKEATWTGAPVYYIYACSLSPSLPLRLLPSMSTPLDDTIRGWTMDLNIPGLTLVDPTTVAPLATIRADQTTEAAPPLPTRSQVAPFLAARVFDPPSVANPTTDDPESLPLDPPAINTPENVNDLESALPESSTSKAALEAEVDNATEFCTSMVISPWGFPVLRQNKTSCRKKTTHFFRTDAATPIAQPPILHTSCPPQVGDVFLHCVLNQGLQIWVLTVVGSKREVDWTHVIFPHRTHHPLDRNLILSFPSGRLSDVKPSWVKAKTASNHKQLPPIYELVCGAIALESYAGGSGVQAYGRI